MASPNYTDQALADPNTTPFQKAVLFELRRIADAGFSEKNAVAALGTAIAASGGSQLPPNVMLVGLPTAPASTTSS